VDIRSEANALDVFSPHGHLLRVAEELQPVRVQNEEAHVFVRIEESLVGRGCEADESLFGLIEPPRVMQPLADRLAQSPVADGAEERGGETARPEKQHEPDVHLTRRATFGGLSGA